MNIEYQLIKRNNDFCTNKEQLKNLLNTNRNYTVEEEIIKYKNIEIDYSIEEFSFDEKNIIFIIKFELKDKKKLDVFENFDKSFLDFIKRFEVDISLNVLLDSISEYYCIKLYPQIYKLENLLRNMIYRFMGKNFGRNWTKKCLPPEVNENIERMKEKNQIENDENILYYADFIQLERFLFLKYPQKYNQAKFIEDLKEANENNKLQEFIDNSIGDYEYKSNWDRYFLPIVDKEQFDKNLSELYKYRNLVAHNRRIRKEEYTKAEKNIEIINKILNQCLEHIEEIEVPENEKQSLEDISSATLNLNESTSFNNFVNSRSWYNITEKINNSNSLINQAIRAENIVSNNFSNLAVEKAIKISNIANSNSLLYEAGNLDKFSNYNSKIKIEPYSSYSIDLKE